ncbi:hypothetical protein YC2023_076189 [Brassica napus]
MQDSTCTNDISFKGGATVDQAKPRNDLLVIKLTIRDIDVARVLIDTGSSADIIFKDTLEKMGIDQFEIVKYPSPLLGLSGEMTMAYGSINIAVKAGTVTRVTEFLVVDRPASYNVIMGTPWLNAMRAIPSTYHLCLKFPTPNGIEVIWGNPRVSQVCYAAEQKRKRPDLETVPTKTEKKVFDQGSRSQDSGELYWQSLNIAAPEEKHELTCEPVVTVCLDEASPERCIEIGANLREPLRTELVTCLKKNLNTFAWAAEDMSGIDIDITCHELNIDLTFKPVKQKRRKLGPERASAVNDEVKKLLKVGSITEVRYPDWLANPVVVKKKNGKWRVCVYFIET